MMIRVPVRLGTICLLATALFNCSAPPSGGTSEREDADEADSAAIGTRSDALGLPPHCYGKMLMTAPYDFVDQPIGLPMTVRINRACDRRAPLVARKLRVYIRRYEVGGVAGPQQLLRDWTDIPGDQYRVDIPWSAGRLADGSTLPAGRYQIYSYSLDASLYDAWLHNDSFARNMSTRSDNTYIELHDAGAWSSTDWSACSAACGGGEHQRTNACQDGVGHTLPSRMCLESAPVTSVACNVLPCGPSPADLCAMGGGIWDGVQACVTPPTPEQLCAQNGGIYNMVTQSCMTEADLCAWQGGMWTGSTCEFMHFPDPMQECAMMGGRFDTATGRCIQPWDDCEMNGGTWTGFECLPAGPP
jgi:hypothetical protein